MVVKARCKLGLFLLRLTHCLVIVSRRFTRCRPCYNFLMKIIEHWLLFKYVEGQFTPSSRPFKTKDQAETARIEVARAGTAGGCGGCDSDREVIGRGGTLWTWSVPAGFRQQPAQIPRPHPLLSTPKTPQEK